MAKADEPVILEKRFCAADAKDELPLLPLFKTADDGLRDTGFPDD